MSDIILMVYLESNLEIVSPLAPVAASSVLLAGLILCTLVIVIFSYATSNHIISNATAQNTPSKKVVIVTASHN